MDVTSWIDVAIGGAWLALALVLVSIRTHNHEMSGWLFVGAAACCTRAFYFIVVEAFGAEPVLVTRVLDAVLLISLVILVVGSMRLGRVMLRQHQRAEHAESEYSRALLEYTQLVRHRIANPLTAVKGGIQTLLDLELAAPVRRAMLESMLESATRLEQVALHPEAVSDEELELHPSPRPLAGEPAMDALTREAGNIEADFRDVNEHIVDIIEDRPARPITFVCECSARDCTSPVVMDLDEYYEIHRDGAQFVIVPEHDLAAVEDVVRREADWWVVKKRGEPGRQARRRA